MKKALFAALFVSTCAGAPAHAQVQCVPRDRLISLLNDDFGERLRTIALDAAGNVVETFANPATGTWTLTTQRAGQLCVLLVGQDYQEVERQLPPNL